MKGAVIVSSKMKSLVVWKPGLMFVITMVALAVVYLRPGEAGTSSPMDTTVDELIIIETDLLIAGFHTLSDLKVADDGRFFVAEKAGQIRIGKSDGTILPDPFLDLSDMVGSDGELGLLSIALHP